jgi:hypothetical protein
VLVVVVMLSVEFEPGASGFVEKLAEAPEGRPPTLKLTELLKPFAGETLSE